MGHRGIFKIMENNYTTGYYTHWGAGTVFSGFYRLKNAYDIQVNQFPEKSISEIFGHLSYEGEYLESEEVTDLIFEQLSEDETKNEDLNFETHSMLEMRVIYDLDSNHASIEFNHFYHPRMGSFGIPINEAIHNVDLTLAITKEHGIEDFIEASKIFEKGSGIYELLLESSRVKEIAREDVESYRSKENEELEVEVE
ncbi:hypothetical protein DesLBE_3699 [Desulfitobacterium sp. LBE]|uniref:hypothetical protein n=1 Tax=Desulfitobacterium sp. LBE TaxID=884086 RepID=UPI00119BBF50|nr:hypothetical protein [Desulfitobacterium sp. LBE]TWH59324.1 hypothetical protein DesLBE_3699 [Desulfitobacterium sp. LBE]